MNEELIKTVVENVLKRLGSTSSPPRPAVIDRVPAPLDYFAPWTGEAFPAVHSPGGVAHPSQEQFNIGEAAETAAVVRELVDFLEAEKCTIEKDKPCDHCGSCRTLGF